MGKETPFRQSGKTSKKGQEIKEEVMPRWAIKRIRLLSKTSGVSYDKILLLVLKFGLYQVKEELTPVINLMNTANHLEDEDEREPEPDLDPVVRHDDIDMGLPTVEEGSDIAGIGRDEYRESNQDNELLALVSGE
jgi:hypothetical protein